MLEAATAMVGLARFRVADVHHGGRQGRGDRGRRCGRGLRRRHRRRRYPCFVFEMGGLRCRGGGGFPGAAAGVCGGIVVDVHDPRSFGRRGHRRTCRHFALILMLAGTPMGYTPISRAADGRRHQRPGRRTARSRFHIHIYYVLSRTLFRHI
jgi:hypothetical protein